MAETKAKATPRGVSKRWVPYAFLAPTVTLLAVGFIAPAVEVIRRSFYEGSIVEDGEFVGMDNYVSILTSFTFWRQVGITLTFTAGSVAGGIALGLAAALVLNRAFRGRALVRTLFFIPWAIPIVPAILVWRWGLDAQFGIINHLLQSLGAIDSNIAWLNSPIWALPMIIVIQIWRSAPFAAIFILAALQNIPHDRYEAASLDGAGGWGRFRYVTVPGIRTVLAILALLKTIWALGTDVTIIFLATQGGPAGATRVLSLAAYQEAFQRYDFGAAATLGALVLILATIPVLFYLKLRGEKDV